MIAIDVLAIDVLRWPGVNMAFLASLFASTALTITLNGMADVWIDGLPIFPAVMPGDAVSPGTRSWSFVKDPATNDTEPPVSAIGEVIARTLVSATFDFSVQVEIPVETSDAEHVP